jgi:hypothetical protein
MADEDTPIPDDKAARKTRSRRANANLRQARRTLESVEWQRDERSDHLVSRPRRRDPRVTPLSVPAQP